jgi:hypothetical protein
VRFIRTDNLKLSLRRCLVKNETKSIKI